MGESERKEQLVQYLKEHYQNINDSRSRSLKEKSWEHISKELSKNRTRTPSKAILAVATIMVILIGAACLQTNQVQAFDWFVNIFVTDNGNSTQITQTTNEETEEGLPDMSNITVEEVEQKEYKVSFEKAQSMTQFYISKPTYLPETYELAEVKVIELDSVVSDVSLRFVDANGELLSLTQSYQPNEFASAKVVDNQDTNVKNVPLSDGEARLVEFKDGIRQIIWSTPHMNWLLEGAISEQEIIKVAESLE
ncbi:DUF4367 domain-containing protein [Gracilibacillus caseinilyticus]|uniref:DUF4367 domain-containing protein n=1 Tax=Gracilibacillus caseinilyticus TaxID=2932256 RepID=A0ABY4EZH6_9BACI|nr:DUF4367 domain-containing protein [Gracilibacillus caseinilyticus]UOQ49247.1 DUF4367 domain-containing protein [Gracilibacillus caseinilyticus]